MPQQNNHPNTKALHNFTAICRQKAISPRIQKKLPNLPLNLLQKTNGALIVTITSRNPQLRQRSPATRLQLIFRTDHKMTAKFWTVLVGAFAHNTWRDFVR
jgi:hypothetical protein